MKKIIILVIIIIIPDDNNDDRQNTISTAHVNSLLNVFIRDVVIIIADDTLLQPMSLHIHNSIDYTAHATNTTVYNTAPVEPTNATKNQSNKNALVFTADCSEILLSIDECYCPNIYQHILKW